MLAAIGMLGALQLRAQEPKREFRLHANSEEFWSIVERDAKLTTVGSGFGFTEGPLWDPSGFVYVSDEEVNKKRDPSHFASPLPSSFAGVYVYTTVRVFSRRYFCATRWTSSAVT